MLFTLIKIAGLCLHTCIYETVALRVNLYMIMPGVAISISLSDRESWELPPTGLGQEWLVSASDVGVP